MFFSPRFFTQFCLLKLPLEEFLSHWQSTSKLKPANHTPGLMIIPAAF